MSIRPEINQFWTSYQKWMSSDSNWGFPMAKKSTDHSVSSIRIDKILIAYYCSAQSSLIVAWIIVDKTMRKKVSSHHSNRFGKE
jgi:hypothetical protein